MVASAVGLLEQLNYNAWYSDASLKLVDATLSELKAGHVSTVVIELDWLKSRYHANYESGLVDYQRLVDEYVERVAEKSV